MAKDKSVKSESHSSKRKKLAPDTTMDAEVKKKMKKKQVEEAPEQIPDVTITEADATKQKKDKKHKKKPVTEQTHTQKAKISDPPCCGPPEGTHELEGEEDLSPEEKRVLERKMKKILKKEEKKKKKKLEAEGEASQKTEASGPTAPQHALDYLTCWAENRTAWKFQKTRQTWLLQHMFDSQKISDDNFSVLLQYLEGLRGTAKDTSVQKALALVEESGHTPDDAVVQQRAHRAREVIQLLS
ncbi:uncharacterized protein C7orf50 homolog [Solea solea]|uniref:uncharacterized protein C7orf50 homolog n=1 Tax=Solea solea TaxID=90069 RepID=UPI002729FD80|nr:uncharacterized protein C7orf50 homolog [Solea solea]XP_058477495.1 uncharacterized protein C7orf50 homolog [Solea solea]